MKLADFGLAVEAMDGRHYYGEREDTLLLMRYPSNVRSHMVPYMHEHVNAGTIWISHEQASV